MRVLKLGVFLLFFCIDVGVKAINLPTLKQPVEDPVHCLHKSELCSIATQENTKFSYESGSTRLILGSKTIVNRVDMNHYSLIEGMVFVKTEDLVFVGTEFGDVEVHHGKALILRDDREVIVQSLGGSVVMNGKGGVKLFVDKGFQNHMTSVGPSGRTRTGIPQLIDLKALVRNLGALHEGSKKEFRQMVETWYREWPSLVSKASEIHAQMIERSISSEAEKQKQIENFKKARQKEQEHLRRLFKEKNFIF